MIILVDKTETDLAYSSPASPIKFIDVQKSDQQCLLESKSRIVQFAESEDYDNLDNKVTSEGNESPPESESPSRSASRLSNNSAVCRLSPVSSQSAVSVISPISKSEDTVMDAVQSETVGDAEHSDVSARNLDDEEIDKYIDDDEDHVDNNEETVTKSVNFVENTIQSPRLVNYLTNHVSEKEGPSPDLLTQSAYYRRMRLNTASTLDLPVSLDSNVMPLCLFSM